MNVAAPHEQVLLRDAATSWARDRAPIAALRALRGRADHFGFDPQLYREMAEMGWTGMVVPESDGGFDFGHASLGLLAEELGRTLAASPLISTAVIAAGALTLAGSPAQKAQWLPRIVSGEIHAALALDEGARHDPAATGLAACRDDGGWRLDGIKRPVFDGMGAALLLVAARTSADGITLFLCPGDAPGLAATPLNLIDSRGAALVQFTGCRLSDAEVLGEVNRGMPLLEQLLDRGRAVLAAEMLGSAQAAFETTVEYLKVRVQFDKPIGSFQALQHRAADILGELELTRSAVQAALAAIDADVPDTARLASLAKALAGKTFRKVAQEMVQMHGGIGMTDEHDAGLYLKRAQVADMMLGNAAYHRERYARLSGF
jgi:alkylation response protein AidB-like acyl-CoA dehydrogenase